MLDFFGGPWTVQKLNILKGYLNAYTTVMKNQAQYLVYIDAFAGSGILSHRKNEGLAFQEVDDFYKGSAQIAVQIDNNPFDRLVFIEIDASRCIDLERIKATHQHRSILVKNEDSNLVLKDLKFSKDSYRGVIFLDPFGAQVEWKTIEAIAQYQIFDVWILFPISTIARLMPLRQSPTEINASHKEILNKVFGGDSWAEVYLEQNVDDMWNTGHTVQFRYKGVSQILAVYKRQLQRLFGDGFLDKPCTLYLSNNSPLFEFIFCVGNPSEQAISIGKNIASHLIDKFNE